MKIAAYAIAKNEEKHVHRWCANTSWADYRVVVDTGSKDLTWALLGRERDVQRHRIMVSPWRFDMARNAALTLVPDDVDVCVSLDMDEVTEPEFFAGIREAWTEGSFHRASVPLTAGGATFRTDSRVHYRHNYLWKHAVHEIITPYYTFPERVIELAAGIRHLPDDDKSRGQYLDLLILDTQENPGDWRGWVYLCRERYFRGDKPGCAYAAERVVYTDAPPAELAAVCRWAMWATAGTPRYRPWEIETMRGPDPAPWHPVP